jgi:multiple sugar transport system permease protein
LLKLANTRDKQWYGLYFALPALIYMLIFVGYPILSNIIISFQDVTIYTINEAKKPFVGLANYTAALKDPTIWLAMKNTLLFTAGSILFQFIIGFSLALFFNGEFWLTKPIRGLLMIPWMIPITITGLIFKFIFSSNVGIMNEAMKLLGMEPIDWLIQTRTALAALVTANIWIGIPFNMILLSTGLTVIPKSLYESADLAGANKVQTFFYITLPQMKPAIESILVLGFIYTFKVFDLVYVMTGGGPVNRTQMMSTYSYKLSFTLFKYSSGATVANILFLVLVIVGWLYIWFQNKEERSK